MSTYDAPDAARIPYDSFRHSKLVASLVLLLLAAVAIVAVIFALPQGHWNDLRVKGLDHDCRTPECVSPRQVITPGDAHVMKRLFARHALVVDIAPITEGTAFGADLKAPFVESATPSGLTFHLDFADKVDDALRAAGMGYDEPVILLSPSLEHSVLAALLLQERGYRGVLVVR